jgi:hypothetical protein
MISVLCVYYLPPAAAKWEKRGFSGTPRTPAKDAVLCAPVLYVACGGERKRSCGGSHAAIKDAVLCTPVFHNHYAGSFSLCFFECAGDFAEGEFISVVDRCCFIWLQALAVDACGVGAVQVGDCVGAADMLNGCMDA